MSRHEYTDDADLAAGRWIVAGIMLTYFIVNTLFAGVLVLFGMGWKDAYIVGMFLMWGTCSVLSNVFGGDSNKDEQQQKGQQ